MSGVERITKERRRHFDIEGWTPEHDDQYVNGELALAACCYAYAATLTKRQLARVSGIYSHQNDEFLRENWPWDSSWWKPSDDPARNLEKSGALSAAEIDRLERLEEKDNAEVSQETR